MMCMHDRCCVHITRRRSHEGRDRTVCRRHTAQGGALDRARVRQPASVRRPHHHAVLELRALQRHGVPVPLSDLAEELVFERTSLYRALEPMRREGLVAFIPGLGRAKLVALSPAGIRRIAKAMPHWTKAQEAFVARFGRKEWSLLANQLVEVVGIARAMPLDDL